MNVSRSQKYYEKEDIELIYRENWHVGKHGPIERGFDEFYGLLGGFTSFWDEKSYVRLPENRPKREYIMRGNFTQPMQLQIML